MAWTGTPTVKRVGKNSVRITGVSVASGATATIGAVGAGADITLPSDFPNQTPVGLVISDMVEIDILRPYSGGGAVATHLHTDIAEDGSGRLLVTFRNDTGNTSGALDIRLMYQHSLVR